MQGRRQDFFQGGSEGHILDFPGGVGDQNFAYLYGQNKKIAEPGGQPTPPWPPCRRPCACVGHRDITVPLIGHYHDIRIIFNHIRKHQSWLQHLLRLELQYQTKAVDIDKNRK